MIINGPSFLYEKGPYTKLTPSFYVTSASLAISPMKNLRTTYGTAKIWFQEAIKIFYRAVIIHVRVRSMTRRLGDEEDYVVEQRVD